MRLSLITTLILLAASAFAADTAATTAKPWYIGPKGGDVRKGHTPSPGELWVAVHGTDAVPAIAATASPKPWYIGPKGGDTRKGAR